VVEDGAPVRALVTRILRKRGYRVLEAASGLESLGLVETEPDIDLLVTDVVLPGMNGRELAKAVAAISPSTKALFMSGYTRDAVVHSGRLDPDITLLEKPFRPDTPAKRVRDMLDAAS
jgi:CheY-like chemotaxis protein